MLDLKSVRTWRDFGAALHNAVEVSGFSLDKVGRGVIHRNGPVKVTSYISRATYFRVLRGESRPPRPALVGVLSNIDTSEADIAGWLACWERLIRDHAETAHIVKAVTSQKSTIEDQNRGGDSFLSAAASVVQMILRRRSRLRQMRKSLGPNHPYVVTFEFDTECYLKALVDPEVVRARVLLSIERSVYEGHARPRRFGSADEFLGRIDEYLMALSAVEDALQQRDAAGAYREDAQHDPFQTDFAELTTALLAAAD